MDTAPRAFEPRCAMQIATQLAVFLENKPGTFAAVCQALADAKINIFALTVSDTVDHAVVRMVVSDTAKAIHLFGEHGVLVVENEVLMIEADNKPGVLVEIASKMARAKVNIEYAYLSGSPRSKKALIVIRPSNAQKAFKALS